MTGNKIAMIKATLKYTQQAEVIEAMKPLISTRGLFILTRTTRPVGSEVHFEFKLADNSITYAGEGIVRKEIPFVGGPSSQRSGMLVALRKINRPFKEVVDAVIGAQQQSDRSITPSAMQPVPPEAIKPEPQAQTAEETPAKAMDVVAAADQAQAAETREEQVQADNSPKNHLIVDTKNSDESLDLFGDLDMEESLDSLFSGIAKKPEPVQNRESASFASPTVVSGLMERPSSEYDFNDAIDMGDMDMDDVEAVGFDESDDINALAGEAAEHVIGEHATATDFHSGDENATPVPDPIKGTAEGVSENADDVTTRTVIGMPIADSEGTLSDSVVMSDESEDTQQLSDSSIKNVLRHSSDQVLDVETTEQFSESSIERALHDADDAMASADASIAAANAVLAANTASEEAAEAIAVAEAAVEAAEHTATDASASDEENAEAKAVAETAISAAQDAIVAAQDAVEAAADIEAIRMEQHAEADAASHSTDATVAQAEAEVKEILSAPLVDIPDAASESPSEVFEALRGQLLEEGERLSTQPAASENAESPSEVFEALRGQFLEEGERLSTQPATPENAESPSEVFEALRGQFLEEGERLSTQPATPENAESPSEVFEALRGQFLEEGERLSTQDTNSTEEATSEVASTAFESLREQILSESTRLNKEMGYESSSSPMDDEVIRDFASDNVETVTEEVANVVGENHVASTSEVADVEQAGNEVNKGGFKSAEAESLFSSLQAEISQPVESASRSLIDNLVSGTPVVSNTQRPNTVSRPRAESASSERNAAVKVDKADHNADEGVEKEPEKKDDLDLSALVKTQESLISNSGKDEAKDAIDLSKMPKRERRSFKSEEENNNQKKGFFGRLFGK